MMRPKSAGRRKVRPKGVPPLAIEGIISRLHGSPERHPRRSWRQNCSDKALGKLTRKRKKKRATTRKEKPPMDFTRGRKARKTSPQTSPKIPTRPTEAKEQQRLECSLGHITIEFSPCNSRKSKRASTRPSSARFTDRRSTSQRLTRGVPNTIEYSPFQANTPKLVSSHSSSSGFSSTTRSSSSTSSIYSHKRGRTRSVRHSPKRPKALQMLLSKDKKDVITGLESVIHNLQKHAKDMELNRYGSMVQGTLTTPMSPSKIVEQIKREQDGLPTRPDRFILDPTNNWWDMPFRDHIKDAERPILKENGLDQFGAEYSLSQLRYQSKQLLERRKRIEHDRIRGPLRGFYKIKGREFHRELRRLNRQQKKEKKKNPGLFFT